MSGFGLIFVDGKIIVSNGGEAAAALIERMSGSLASGEAKAIVVREANGVAPIVEKQLKGSALNIFLRNNHASSPTH